MQGEEIEQQLRDSLKDRFAVAAVNINQEQNVDPLGHGQADTQI